VGSRGAPRTYRLAQKFVDEDMFKRKGVLLCPEGGKHERRGTGHLHLCSSVEGGVSAKRPEWVESQKIQEKKRSVGKKGNLKAAPREKFFTAGHGPGAYRKFQKRKGRVWPGGPKRHGSSGRRTGGAEAGKVCVGKKLKIGVR